MYIQMKESHHSHTPALEETYEITHKGEGS